MNEVSNNLSVPCSLSPDHPQVSFAGFLGFCVGTTIRKVGELIAQIIGGVVSGPRFAKSCAKVASAAAPALCSCSCACAARSFLLSSVALPCGLQAAADSPAALRRLTDLCCRHSAPSPSLSFCILRLPFRQFIFLQMLAWRGYITIHWSKLKEDLDRIFCRAKVVHPAAAGCLGRPLHAAARSELFRPFIIYTLAGSERELSHCRAAPCCPQSALLPSFLIPRCCAFHRLQDTEADTRSMLRWALEVLVYNVPNAGGFYYGLYYGLVGLRG